MNDVAIRHDSPATDAVLNLIAHLPTASLLRLVDSRFQAGLEDAAFMRIAALLALKSYEEGGCPIGAVIVNRETGQIVGKGHNTLVQNGNPYEHGETAAMRDAGRQDFSRTTIYTSLSPCDVCAALIVMRGFGRVVVGDVTNAAGNEERIRESGIPVEIAEDPEAVALYARFRAERPELDLEDWQGRAALARRNG